jgi:hypothetical protein
VHDLSVVTIFLLRAHYKSGRQLLVLEQDVLWDFAESLLKMLKKAFKYLKSSDFIQILECLD